jgi:hypothetical protein
MYCLEPFSVQQAESEEKRLNDELRAWMEQMVGDAALSPGGVDASSRGFIFRDKILPNLQRDVNRALETLASYSQFPLVPPPIPVDVGRGENPLLTQRKTILQLRGLHARFASPEITSFVTTDNDRAVVREMERRVTDFMCLSNIADASAKRNAMGYRSARASLERVLADVNESLAAAEAKEPALASFLEVSKVRYQSLLDFAGVFEHLCSPNPISGQEVSERIGRMAERLSACARKLETLDHDPVQSMPMVIGIDLEVAGARLLCRWLEAYDTMTAKVQLPFLVFIGEIRGLFGDRSSDPAEICDLLEGCSEIFKVVRGEVAAGVLDDHGWVDRWVEMNRKKKFLWIFGVEEQVEQVDSFLLPVWVADVRYSQNKGGMFAEGAERHGLALVDACDPAPDRVVFLPDPSRGPMAAIADPRLVGAARVALPLSTAKDVAPMLASAMQRRQDISNTRVTVRALGFVSAAVVQYASKQGNRAQATALAGQLKTTPEARFQVEAAMQTLQRFN